MKNLAKQDFAPRMSHVSLSNCSLCGQDILWYPTLQHRCPSKNDEDDNSPPDSVRVHLYYPHSIFERLSVEEQEHLLSLIDKEEAGDIDTGQKFMMRGPRRWKVKTSDRSRTPRNTPMASIFESRPLFDTSHASRYLWYRMSKNKKVTYELASKILQWPNLQQESSSERRRL
ncbi:MAG: hypothetical protein J3R72DRAFT_154351 [Linnemannia gamsii]|nr:MAG: hypothetical protein J3R72DRAFT_154351 [Linnemannia gamsii]